MVQINGAVRKPRRNSSKVLVVAVRPQFESMSNLQRIFSPKNRLRQNEIIKFDSIEVNLPSARALLISKRFIRILKAERNNEIYKKFTTVEPCD